jgi:hypothetical protein
MEGHALKMAQLLEILPTTLHIMTGSTAGPSGSSGAAESTTASSRRADAECFAQMSNKFLKK